MQFYIDFAKLKDLILHQMAEVIKVQPLTRYPGNRELKIGESLKGIAIATSAFVPGTDLSGIPRRLIYPEHYIDGDLTAQPDRFLIMANKGVKNVTVAAMGVVSTSSQVIQQELSVSFHHARMEGGLRVALPHEEREYVCFLMPPERKMINYTPYKIRS